MVVLSALTLFVILGSVESSRTDHRLFFSENDSTFNHLAIDKYHGFVFVGGVNRLYQLNENLSLIVKYENGPRYDSPECPIEGDCSKTKNLTNNYNKALVVDNSTGHLRLISCGSIFQGLCLVHNNISNLTSEVVQINRSVVANDAASSTVAFIGPGPTNWSSSLVLYVAATITNNSFYRADMPLITSRSLETDQLLKIAVNHVDSGTQLMLLPGSRYIVNYVYGFSSGSFTYFLTNQIKPDGSFVSKLARICNEDEKYYSYTEIPIKCTSEDGRDYNLAQAGFVIKLNPEYSKLLGLHINSSGDILFVVFSQSKNIESNYPSEHSALCVYSLKEINEIFLQNIRKCIATGGNRGLENIVIERHCIYINMSEEIIKDDFCNLNFDIQLEGNIPVTGMPLIKNSAFVLTAVAAAALNTPNHMMVFLGTSKGHLKKIIVKNPLVTIEIDDIHIDDSPVSPDILFDSKMIHLYAMTKTKLIKVKIHECSKYKTCKSCLSTEDTKCGWCLLQGVCTLRTTCINSSDEAFWIDLKNGSCSSIVSLKPTNVSSTMSENLEIIVENFPNFSDQLQCIFTFSNKTLITIATQDTNVSSMHCYTPKQHLLSSLWPVDQCNITANLSLKTASYPEFVSTNITFFNCSVYNSCKACISLQFPCNWCSTKHQCVYQRNQTSNLILTSENCDTLDDCSGIECCPLINSSVDGRNYIIISNGTTKRIEFNIVTGYIKKENFLCRFLIEDREMVESATLKNNDTLQCNELKFDYSQQKGKLTITFEVLWGKQRRLDNPNNIQLIVYKCIEMSPNCDSCLMLENKYQCGWCKNADQCEIRSQCENGSSVWLDVNSVCPIPDITFIEPECGLWGDPINITIRGTNLGLNIDEDRNITVADIPCIEFKELAPRSQAEIVCQVHHFYPFFKSAPPEGQVKIEVGSFSIYSEQNFTFFDPAITNIYPKQGPKSGGTELTIKGQYLHSNICNFDVRQVAINNIACNLTYKSSSVVMCLTGKSNNSENGKMTVIFGSNRNAYKNNEFYYMDDPIIEKIEELKPKGIPAGGIKIHVRGQNFESIQKPLFYVYNEKKTKRFDGACNALNGSIICLTPWIPDYSDLYIDPDNPIYLDYGFEMDGVDSVQNISTKNSSWFVLYPNPTFHSFDDWKYDPDYDKTLFINGENIAVGLKSEISVKIGNDNCEIETLQKNILTCRLPEENVTKGPKKTGDDFLEVVVYVGHFKQNIGVLHKRQKTYIFYGAAIVVSLLIACGFLYCWCRKCLAGRSQKIKQMQRQMNAMSMETMTLRQCIKRVVIENQIKLNEESLNILKLPNVVIEYASTSIPNNFIEESSQTYYILPPDNYWEFPRSKLILGKCLGEGEFGKVVLGEALGILPDCPNMIVAVKMLKDTNSDSDMIDLVSELEIMKAIGTHNHVLKLLGCCTQHGSLLIITEFACYGNLHDFLRRYLQFGNDKELANIPSKENFLKFALQVAEGMKYLASKKCIHRDLAARNILVSEDYTLKISDFGLARDIQNKNYYKKKTNGRLPVKWMAPEALCHSIYSLQSDVWSYGILLWEILTFGGTPYSSLMDLGNLYQILQSGYRMEKPPNCSSDMYSLMCKCWSFNPEGRPLFPEIVQNLVELLSSDEAQQQNNMDCLDIDESGHMKNEADVLLSLVDNEL